jgi:cytochrome c oxidase subunit 3/cytochrome o ubiquinol oxidase subunit 3
MSNLAATGHSVGHGHAVAHHTSMGIDSRKLGVWAFIGSEVMFFAALITTYLIYKPVNERIEEAKHAANAAYEAQLPHHYLDIELTTVLATILLASSLTMVLALAAVRRGNQRMFRIWLLSTIGLGLSFLGGQAYEFTHLYSEGVTLSSSLFGSTFFVTTGFHGTHVAIGATWLTAVFINSLRHPYGGHNFMDIELGGLYWHFVDLVWVAIFVLLYLI